MIERTGEGIHSPRRTYSPSDISRSASTSVAETTVRSGDAPGTVSRLYKSQYRLLDAIACIRRGRPARASVLYVIVDNLYLLALGVDATAIVRIVVSHPRDASV